MFLIMYSALNWTQHREFHCISFRFIRCQTDDTFFWVENNLIMKHDPNIYRSSSLQLASFTSRLLRRHYEDKDHISCNSCPSHYTLTHQLVPSLVIVKDCTYELLIVASSFHSSWSITITSKCCHVAYLVVLLARDSDLCVDLLTPSYTTHRWSSVVQLAGNKSNLGSIGEAETLEIAGARRREIQACFSVILIVFEVFA